MISKVISTFDHVLPVEDTPHLLALLDVVERCSCLDPVHPGDSADCPEHRHLYAPVTHETKWNPLDHVPADPQEMYQKGWVCNSKRAEIKAAYERRLHQEYTALFNH